MALRSNPDGTVSILDDLTGLPMAEGLPPDMLGSLYQQGTPPPAMGPDLRTASIGGGGGAGGTTGNVPAQATGAEGQSSVAPPQMSVAPPVASPGIPTSRLAAPGAPGSMPTGGPSAAPPSAQPGGPVAVQSPDVANYLRRSMVGGGGRKVEAKDQLQGFSVQQAPELSDATKAELATANTQQQLAAEYGGQLQSASAEDAAAAFGRQREQAQLDIARIRDEERERDRIVGGRMRMLDMQMDELRDARKDAANPDAYWEDKGVLGTVMAKIGMAIYAGGGALGGYDPMGLAKQIAAEADKYNQSKRVEVELIGQEIAGSRTQLDDIRKQFISPDAADAATRALMLESAAAETSAQAQYYKSAESQGAATQLVAAFRTQAAKDRAAAELAEQDAVTQAWKHVPAHVAGGAAGGIAGLMAAAKKLGITDVSEAMRAASSGILPYSKNELELAKMELQQRGSRGHMQRRSDVEKGTIQLPEGGVAYHPNMDVATKQENIIHSVVPWRANLQKIKKIMSGVSTISKLSPEDRAEVEGLAARSVPYVKAVAEEALTTGEDEIAWSKLRGANVQSILRLASDSAALDTAIEATDQFDRRARGRLRKVPGDYTGPMPEPLVPPVQSREEK